MTTDNTARKFRSIDPRDGRVLGPATTEQVAQYLAAERGHPNHAIPHRCADGSLVAEDTGPGICHLDGNSWD